MICNNCGRQIQNEAANFCEYCGFSFREQTQAARPEGGQNFNSKPDMQQGPVPVSVFGQPRTAMQQPGISEKPISFLSWLGTYALLLVPYVGWLIFIIMLFVWAFGNNTPVTKKNWARVTLIFVGIVTVFVILFIIIFYVPMLQQIMSGNFDYNSYYENLLQNLK